ncbi:hypothetical protein NPIL_214881 [Nephila pilipes]|uniref:Uncharacterized protein n=1 Tax=Nephila pilipes TaxID=299642 RepID=A0A8X6N9G6_NEPPI|nr:hypothetical protein NPIL_214881 [Nephila pilipes]
MKQGRKQATMLRKGEKNAVSNMMVWPKRILFQPLVLVVGLRCGLGKKRMLCWLDWSLFVVCRTFWKCFTEDWASGKAKFIGGELCVGIKRKFTVVLCLFYPFL